MNASEILSAVNAGEDKDWEFKSAKGGTPRSLWETYSAMANTDGGVIVLGVKEHEGDFEVQGLDDSAKTEKDFWTTINNRGKVSVNLLANDDVRIVPVNGNSVLIVQVWTSIETALPPALRLTRGSNWMTGGCSKKSAAGERIAHLGRKG